MSYRRKRLALLLGTLAMTGLMVSGCGQKGNETKDAKESTEKTTVKLEDVTKLNESDMFTDRDLEIGYDKDTAVAITLKDEKSSCDSSNVKIKDDIITIQKEGTYIISGSLKDGQLVVDADSAKVQLVLDGVDVSCKDSAAVYVRNDKKVFVTTTKDSKNTFSNESEFVAIDDNNIDGVIF